MIVPKFIFDAHMSPQKIIYISDGTGITAETLGTSLLSQFKSRAFVTERYPYIDDIDKAQELSEKLIVDNRDAETKPILFASLVDENIRKPFNNPLFHFFDLFGEFIPKLSQCLQESPDPGMRRVHSMQDSERYTARIDAVNYALNCDDGLGSKHYPIAEVILIGVSRSGKTPTSLYLALNFGVLCANYPFTEESLESHELPKVLEAHKGKLFGLTISPQRLCNIRQARRAKSRYADYEQCQKELNTLNRIYQKHGIPYLDTTERSIEEIATIIMTTMHLKRS